MKKIIVFVDLLGGNGGTEKVINDVLKYYKDSSKFEVSIVNFGSISTKKWVNKGVKQINFFPFSFIRKIKGIRKFLFLFELLFFSIIKTDIVITIHLDTLKILAIAKKINLKKFEISSWIHFGLKTSQFFSEKNFKELIKYSDSFLSITDENTDFLLEKHYPKEKIITLYNPVKRQEKTIAINNQKFIYIGRLTFGSTTQKNNKEMLDAFSIIKDLNWSLDIYGDGEDRIKEQEYVKELKIDKKIKFIGWKDSPFEEIEQAAAIISTSTHEGFGLSMIEALSYGIPVISSNIEGPKVFLSSQNSLCYQLGNVDELALILKKFIQKKISFQSSTIKNSIEPFYEENYFYKFNQFLDGEINGKSK